MYELPSQMMSAGAGPPPAYYNRAAYPYGPALGYGHPPAVAIVERPGIVSRTTDTPMSARGARPVSIHGTPGLVQYNPNAGMTLSARRPLKPTAQQSEGEDQSMRRRKDTRTVAVEDDDTEEESEVETEYEEEDDMEEQAAAADLRARMVQPQPQGDVSAEMLQKMAIAKAIQRKTRSDEQRRQRQQMPPPVAPASTHMTAQQNGPRLSMRKMNGPAPQITYGGRRPSGNEATGDDHRATLRALAQGSMGTSATRRPSLASSGGTKATSYSHPTGNARVTVEDNRKRRLSYMGSEDRARLEAMHAGFQPQDQHPRTRRSQPDFTKIITDVVQGELEKLNLSPTATRSTRFQVPMDAKLREALNYQNRTDEIAPLPNIPLTEAALRRKTGIPSRSGSLRSKRSSEDGDTRISAGHRLTAGSDAGNVTVNGDEMKVRIDTSNGFEMEFEGRLVRLQPVGDGSVADLIIGGRRESSYLSTRGSTATKSVAGGTKLGRAPSTRERDRDRNERDRNERDRQREYERERDRDQRRDRDRARYYSDGSEDDRRTHRTSRRRAETYDSEYSRTGQMRRPQSTDRRRDDYPYQQTRYTGPGYPGYPGYQYPSGYASQTDNVFGA